MSEKNIDETNKKITSLLESDSRETLSPGDIKILKKIIRIYRIFSHGFYIWFLILFVFFTLIALSRDIYTVYDSDRISD